MVELDFWTKCDVHELKTGQHAIDAGKSNPDHSGYQLLDNGGRLNVCH